MRPSPLEVETIRAAQNGDRSAFTGLVSHYKVTVYNLAWRMVYDRDQAMDLSQEIFLRLHRNFDRWDDERPFHPWFMQLSTNVCLNWKRKKQLKTWSIDSAGGNEERLWEPAGSGNEDPMVQIKREETQQTVREVISELPKDYRVVVTLRYLENLPYDEIAEIVGIPLGTVKIRLFRARDLMKKRLEHAGWVEGLGFDG